MPFMHKDEALKTIHLFGAANESDRISKSALRDWVVIMHFNTFTFVLAINQQLKSMPVQILEKQKR